MNHSISVAYQWPDSQFGHQSAHNHEKELARIAAYQSIKSLRAGIDSGSLHHYEFDMSAKSVVDLDGHWRWVNTADGTQVLRKGESLIQVTIKWWAGLNREEPDARFVEFLRERAVEQIIIDLVDDPDAVDGILFAEVLDKQAGCLHVIDGSWTLSAQPYLNS